MFSATSGCTMASAFSTVFSGINNSFDSVACVKGVFAPPLG